MKISTTGFHGVSMRGGALGCIAAVGVAWALPAWATEGGGQQFPIGVDTVAPAMLPPPGQNMLLSYTVGYTANRQNDNSGNPSQPGFDVDVFVEATKLIHTWTNLYGVDIGSGMVVGVNNTDLTVVPGVVKGHEFGMIDTDLLPIMLHADVGGGLHLGFATNIWIPTGTYSRNNPASMGFNRTSVGLQFITTWMPTEKWDLSTSTIVEFGAKNHKTEYYSGTYTNTDFQASYRFFDDLPRLALGVSGYYFQQLEDDRVNGQIAHGTGYRGMAVALGPQIRYDAWDHGAIVLKYQHELAAENRTQGDKFWLQLGIPF
ncbi:MAG: transporter [Rhodospirillaceae bacterium]|nr:transporter [Rhodospirillaceae bacterium]